MRSEPTIELRHLRAFAMVASELHFTRAAARLHLSQQALSTHIRQLERSLGVALFTRTTRTVELTTAGETLLSHANDLLAAFDVAVRDTKRSAAGLDGQLRVGHVPVIGQRGLDTLIDVVMPAFDGVEVLRRECWMEEAMNAVRDGRLDAVLVVFASHGPELASMTVRRESLGVVLGASHPAMDLDAVTPSALAQSTLAVVPREISPGLFDRVMATFPDHAREQRVYELKSVTRQLFMDDPTCRRELAAGRSFFVMPATHASLLPDGVVWRELQAPLTADVDLVWRLPVHNDTLRRLLDVIREKQPPRRQG